MEKTTFSAIAAMASNRVIGIDGQLPWHIPEDFKFFKATTSGHPVVMGRTTFESIGRPLPKRRNIVLSSTMEPQEGVEVVRSVAELETLLGPNSGEVFILGGSKVYAQFLPKCDVLYLTYVGKAYDGDAYFPDFEDLFEFEKVLGGGDGFEFRRYVKR